MTMNYTAAEMMTIVAARALTNDKRQQGCIGSRPDERDTADALTRDVIHDRRGRGRDDGRQHDGVGQAHAEQHAECRTDRHQQFRAPEQFAGDRG